MNKSMIMLPPSASDLEEVVIGACLLEKEAIGDVVDILTPDTFYQPKYATIFMVMVEMFDKGQVIDIVTVTNALRKHKKLDEVGGAHEITDLTNRVSSSANIEHHARIIQEFWVRREYIRIFSDSAKKLYDQSNETVDILDEVERVAMSVSSMIYKKNEKSMRQVIKSTIDAIERAYGKEGAVTGVPSGHTDLDRCTGGWQNTDLIILAARPGMGKTTFILHSIKMAAQQFKVPIGVFSLEMSDIQLGQKMISMETKIGTHQMRSGNMGKAQWEAIMTRGTELGELAIYIDDTAAMDIRDIKAKARKWKKKYDIGLFVIDYLQLITTTVGNNRNTNIEYITGQLKAIAKELNVPVVALSQLSRALESRSSGQRRPQLSDLRDSGAIEQDADIVIFLYREDYYKDNPEDTDGNSLNGVTEVIIAKHRNGAHDTFYKMFKPITSEFLVIEKDEPVKEVGLPYKEKEDITDLPF